LSSSSSGEDDLTTRVAEFAASIKAHLAEDEAVANALDGATWRAGTDVGDEYNIAVVLEGADWQIARCGIEKLADGELKAAHIARQDPARTLRRVKATRDLVAAILAERHDYNDGDSFYSCSQAVEYGTDGEPGSGCSNDERAGRPCDCGRDARVARLLGIIAGEWEAA
jgi:Family of unknown function (DUF6221)